MIINLRFGSQNIMQRIEENEYVVIEHCGNKAMVTIFEYSEYVYLNKINHIFDDVDEILVEC